MKQFDILVYTEISEVRFLPGPSKINKMALTDNLGCEDKGNSESEIKRITTIQYLKAMYHIAKSCFTHPFSTTIVEFGNKGKIRTYKLN